MPRIRHCVCVDTTRKYSTRPEAALPTKQVIQNQRRREALRQFKIASLDNKVQEYRRKERNPREEKKQIQ
jgi:hypothetical protein